MFTKLHSSTNEKLFEKYVCNQIIRCEQNDRDTPQQSSVIEVSIALLCQLCSTRCTAIRIKNCLKSTSVIKVATIKHMDKFRYAKEAITCNHRINAFHYQCLYNSMYRYGKCSVHIKKKINKKPGHLGELVGPETYNLLCVALYRHLMSCINLKFCI